MTKISGLNVDFFLDIPLHIVDSVMNEAYLGGGTVGSLES